MQKNFQAVRDRLPFAKKWSSEIPVAGLETEILSRSIPLKC